MTYAIVGSGNVGSALARLFARAGITVSIANTRGQDSVAELTEVLGPTVHPVTLEKALDSEVIFMAIPFGAIEQFGKSRPDWTGKTVVDTTNAHHTPNWAEILGGRTSSRYAAEHLPGAAVVKAFNQLPANVLAAELEPGAGRRVIFLAADDPDAADRITTLIDALGLAAVQVGGLDDGGRLIQAPDGIVLRNFLERPLF